MTDVFAHAFSLISGPDPALVEILVLSLRVTLLAVLVASLIAFPLGAFLAVARFRGRGAVIIGVNALMGLPPVVVGLALYLMLSASGPIGVLQLLYTPTAMVIAQVVLVTPIITALARQIVAAMHAEYDEMLRSMGSRGWQTMATLLWDARFALLTAALAGFGRASAEVGAVMIVGGNINHVTRTMTTAIALETSRGELALALALGLVLLAMTLVINAVVTGTQLGRRRDAHG